MASYTAHHVTGTGLTIYAKQLPLNTSTWSTGVTAMTEVLTTGIYTATLASQNRYLVFVQSGGSPAATDAVDGSFDADLLLSLTEDVGGLRFTAKALEQGPVTPTQFPPPAFIPPAQPNKQTIFLYQGDTYDGTARPVLEWEVDKDFQSWSGTMTIRHRVTNAVLLEATATAANATRITVTLDADDTAFADLVDPKEFGPHPFDVQFTSGNSVLTPVDGVAVITREKTEPTPP
jgi:hypothetical protein